MPEQSQQAQPMLQMINIHKSFGRVRALRGVDFDILPGEVIGLCGDNGAGKSTLIKVISGYHQADEGQIFLEGKLVDIKSPHDSRALGIETVYQDQAAGATTQHRPQYLHGT